MNDAKGYPSWRVLSAVARAQVPDTLLDDARMDAIKSCLRSTQGQTVSVDRTHGGARLRFVFDVETWACIEILRELQPHEAHAQEGRGT